MDAIYEEGKLYTIALEELNPDPEQPRIYFDNNELTELTESIKALGVIDPVLFRLGEDGKLYLVCGERRYRAACAAGLKKIPAVFLDSKEYRTIALIDNIQRQNLTALEEAEAVKKLLTVERITQEELAAKLGKAPSTLNEILRITELPQKLKEKVYTNPRIWSRAALLEVVREKDPKKQRQVFSSILKKLTKGRITGKSRIRKTKVDAVDKMLKDVVDKVEKLLSEQYEIVAEEHLQICQSVECAVLALVEICRRNDYFIVGFNQGSSK